MSKMAENYTHTHTHTHLISAKPKYKKTVCFFIFLLFFIFSFPVYSVETSSQTIKYYFTLSHRDGVVNEVLFSCSGEGEEKGESGCCEGLRNCDGVCRKCCPVSCGSNEYSKEDSDGCKYCEECEDTSSHFKCPIPNGTDANGCPTYKEKSCSAGEYLDNTTCSCQTCPTPTETVCDENAITYDMNGCPEQEVELCSDGMICENAKCVVDCPAFDDTLTENGCRKKKTDENGCPYWEEESDCVPCTIKTSDVQKLAYCGNGRIISPGRYLGGHIQGTWCGFSVSEYYGNMSYTHGASLSAIWTYYPDAYTDLSLRNDSEYDGVHSPQIYGRKKYADECQMGKACINGTCRPASECSAGYGVINGICSKYYIDCPANSRPSGNGDCSCNDGYYPTNWKSYLTSDNSGSSSMTNRVSSCSKCPDNSTGKNGSCSCKMGYAAIDKTVSWKAATGNGSYERKILSSCQLCSNPVPANARRTGSCTSIQCNDGYYATAYQKYTSPTGDTPG